MRTRPVEQERNMPPGPPSLPSERTFGLFFALVFSLLAAYWNTALLPAAIASALLGFGLLVAAFWKPRRLRRLNRGWQWLGMALGRIVSPVVLGALFFLLLTPVALLVRALGRDALRLRSRQATSYWVTRDETSPDPASFRYQF